MPALDQYSRRSSVPRDTPPVPLAADGVFAVPALKLASLLPLPKAGGWASLSRRLARLGTLGFSHATLPLPDDWGEYLGRDALLSRFIKACQKANLGAVLSLRIDRADAASYGRLADAARGAAGFYLASLQNAQPEAVRAFSAAAQESALLIGEMAGTPISRLPALAGTGLTHVTSSYPWWDGKAMWFWREYAALLRLGEPLHPLGGLDGDPSMLAFRARLAAILGAGTLVPENTQKSQAEGPDGMPGRLDALLKDSNALADRLAACGTEAALLSAPGAPVIGVLRGRPGRTRLLALANTDPAAPHSPPASLLAAARQPASCPMMDHPPLAPLSCTIVDAMPSSPVLWQLSPAPMTIAQSAVDAGTWARIAIENVSPAVDDGAFPARRIAGEAVEVEADILCEGHDVQAVALQWRAKDEAEWQETRMEPIGNDRWRGTFPLTRVGDYVFQILAWRDEFGTYREELRKKFEARNDITLELQEGRALVAHLLAGHEDAPEALKMLQHADDHTVRAALLAPGTAEILAAYDLRPFLVRSLPYPVEAERLAARFASWYEIFPRSMSGDANRHGTFRDVEKHLPRIRDMGFDVLYFPPIHPIGQKNRKGRNNTLTPSETDPGSPYAIGSQDGGHDALHPELGSLDDFRHMRDAAARHGLELALDFAVQCSPDHPWLRQHPGWFAWRPDGTIKYAENPPKKYQDIVNVDFYAAGAVPGLWQALYDVVMLWVSEGVRIFRVDNPHTKPFPFWQWLIAEIRATHPDTLFLAEAFTRPKIMYRLAKIGFSQSYTYFTWRNGKAELTEYLQELTQTAPRDFFRPNLFVNTPDINPPFLQTSGRPGFRIRAALAATLSGLWGVYSGFELCEGHALPGREEYADSEKYEIKAWDWDRPGNIIEDIALLNRLRRDNPALQSHLTVRFLIAWNESVLFYEKSTPNRDNVLLVAVNLDPFSVQETDIELPLWLWNLPDDGTLMMEDLVGGHDFAWRGKIQHIRLDPRDNPYAIWRAQPLR